MNEAEFQHWVSSWIRLQETWDRNLKGHPLFWAADKFREHSLEEPEFCWKAILSILARSPRQEVLDVLSAGPLVVVSPALHKK